MSYSDAITQLTDCWFIDFVGGSRYRKNLPKIEEIEFKGFGVRAW
jgi:hypothetical protein